jgi:hypothetical protein
MDKSIAGERSYTDDVPFKIKNQGSVLNPVHIIRVIVLKNRNN